MYDPISLDLFNFVRASIILQIALMLVSKIFVLVCKTMLPKVCILTMSGFLSITSNFPCAVNSRITASSTYPVKQTLITL